MLFHREAFNHTCFYTEIFLHRDTFTQRCFCTGLLSHTEMMFLHTNTFTERWFYIEQFYTQMPKQTEALLQRNVLARGAFTYGHFCADILLHDFRRRTCIWRKIIQQAYAKSHFHSFWGSRRISWERVGPAQTHIAIWPQCMMIDISRKRVAFHGHQSMLTWRSRISFTKIKIVVALKKLISTCVFTSAPLHLRLSTSRCRLNNHLHLHLWVFRNTPAYKIYIYN